MPEAAIADGVAAAVSHPLTVQVINQGPGIWGNVATGMITGLLTGGIALTGIWLTHRFTLRREQKASEDKLQKERYFIATELIFILEQYADGCAKVATDRGEADAHGEHEPVTVYPELEISNVAGDWRTLPVLLMYRIRELPVMQKESVRSVGDVGEYDHPPHYSDYFRERRYQFTRLGLKAIFLAKRLRVLVCLPESRLDVSEWSAQPVMWRVWRRERRRRAKLYIQHKKELEVWEIQDSSRDVTAEGGD